MSLGSLREDLLHHSLLIAVMVLFFGRYPFTSAALVLVLGFLQKRRSFLFLVLLVCVFSASMYLRTDRNISEGRVVTVRDSYCIVQNGEQKLLLYTDRQPLLDSRLSFACTPEKIISSPLFYRRTFARNMQSHGVTESCRINGYQVIRPSHSIRGYMQKRTYAIEDEQIQRYVQRILLDMHSADDDLISSLRSSGFSLIGITYVISSVLKFFTDRKHRNTIILILQGILICIYHFPVNLLFSFLYRLSGYTSLNAHERLGLCILSVLFLFPYAVLSSGTVMMILFRLLRLYRLKTEERLLADVFIQSILFQRVSLLKWLLYGIILPVYGILWFMALFCLYRPISLLAAAVHLFDRFTAVTDLFSIPGSVLGAGLPVYLIMVLIMRGKPYIFRYALILFLIFQYTGLFHPLAEVTFVNVGQGDAILIRQPFNTCNILVDTGRPSAYTDLRGYLQALGIRRIDLLLISHIDDDHDGNAERVESNYGAEVIRDHFGTLQRGRIRFYDLNTIDDADDSNRSSQTVLFAMNGLTYLLTGDIDLYTEEVLLREYDDLHCDILKLAHHGSDTASGDAFLERTRPLLAVVSAGLNNYYGHPHPSVIQRLKDWHIDCLNTAVNGDIRILCLPHVNLLITADKKTGILLPG